MICFIDLLIYPDIPDQFSSSLPGQDVLINHCPAHHGFICDHPVLFFEFFLERTIYVHNNSSPDVFLLLPKPPHLSLIVPTFALNLYLQSINVTSNNITVINDNISFFNAVLTLLTPRLSEQLILEFRLALWIRITSTQS